MLTTFNTQSLDQYGKLGAWVAADGVHFRVWAPACHSVDVVFEENTHAPCALTSGNNGCFTGVMPDASAGDLYRLRLDGKDSYPDPCSRYQPQGPHGPSMIVDLDDFAWEDSSWQARGLSLKGEVLYEVHVGTFSPSGTYDGLIKELRELKRLGITILEIMPLAEFPGKHNWGYDGVGLYAPPHMYGHPHDLQRLVNEAHKLGLGIILDVVYNHVGPDGNYLNKFSPDYFSTKHTTDWGEAINFDGRNAAGVREFFLTNACYWIKNFHMDGLRLDATQNIYDDGPVHILQEITETVRRDAAPKSLVIVGENECQHVRLMQPVDEGGYGLDGLWNDDFHHSAVVAMTGRREAYYSDYLGRAHEFVAMMKRGFLYQGQFYAWQDNNRGTPVNTHIKPANFVVFLQNHDQIANSLDGKRLHQLGDPALYRALTAMLLLGPNTPMLFMGQEFAADSPFCFFVDHNKDLAPKVKQGRREFLAQFPSIKRSLDLVPDPQDPALFKSCVLDFAQRETHADIYRLHYDLLRLRRNDEVLKEMDAATTDCVSMDAAVLNDHSFVLRYRGQNDDRLIVFNFGIDLDFTPCPEPLLAPLAGMKWAMMWGSDDPAYGGIGNVESYTGKGWYISRHSAQMFKSVQEKK